jgi:hypothetical protein
MRPTTRGHLGRDHNRVGRGPDGRDQDPRRHAARLLRPALASLPPQARGGKIRQRADAGYFAGELARAALLAGVAFAIGARRIAPLWRILDGIDADAWTDAIDMPTAQAAVARYCPDWWPAATRLLIHRVRLDVAAGQVSADPRPRRSRTLHTDQRALPLAELADLDAVYGYSFIVTNTVIPAYTSPSRSIPDSRSVCRRAVRARAASRAAAGPWRVTRSSTSRM